MGYPFKRTSFTNMERMSPTMGKRIEITTEILFMESLQQQKDNNVQSQFMVS